VSALSASRVARVTLSGAALLGLVLLLAGCGGSSSPGVASVAGSKATGSPSSPVTGTGGSGGAPAAGGTALSSASSAQSGMALAGGSGADMLKFSACMRANGVANFPDPNGSGAIQFSSSSGVDPRSASFQAAQQKCQKYTGGGKAPSPAQQAQAQAQALAFSACMRSHGEPSFPDPQFSGGTISVRISGGPGKALDPSSPIFQAAQKACAADRPGAIGGTLPIGPGK
jgi:hypothetical protein